MAKTKILIAIDEPDWAKTIVNAAYNFIDKKNSEITLINVIETNISEENYFYSKPEKFIEHESQKTNFRLLESFLEKSEANYKGFIYKEGNAADILINLAEKDEYDLLVIGSHNKSTVERILLGSVAYKVTRFGKKSVLVVNTRSHIEASNSMPFSVLMGVDASSDSMYAADNLWRFIDKKRAKVSLLNVLVEPSLIIPPDAYIYIDIDKIIEESNHISENLLNLTTNKLTSHGIKVIEKYHIQGDAASSIIDESKVKGHNLIVVGSHGGGNISRWFLGSVSTKVYEHASIPVLIVKKPK